MPYYTDTSSAPKIVDEVGKRTVITHYGVYDGGSITGFRRIQRVVTTQQYRLVGMTESAAVAGVTATSDTNFTEDRTARRTSADGAWQIQVSRDSYGYWASDTESF
jgi:hypothetical protein